MRKCVTSYGRPQAASMPHRTEMGILAHFPLGVDILLRNRRRKRSTENPGQAVPLPPSRKKIPPMRPPLNTTLRLNCYNDFRKFP